MIQIKYDIVGSFLRPEAIKKARAEFKSGAITREDLKKVEDEEIAKLEEKIASLDRQIAANATNSVKLRELMEEQEKVREQLEEKEERWMYLNELAEEFGL